MADIPASAIVRFTQYGTGAVQDADLAELSSLARAPEAPELWEINMHRHSQAFTHQYCAMAQTSVAKALRDVRPFDPWVCHITARRANPIVLNLGGAGRGGGRRAQATTASNSRHFGPGMQDKTSRAATFTYSHLVRETGRQGEREACAVQAYFIASFVGETLGTKELGFVALRHTISITRAESDFKSTYECIYVDADVASDRSAWLGVGGGDQRQGAAEHAWVTGKWADGDREDGSWCMIFDDQHRETLWTFTLIPSHGIVQPTQMCTPDGLYSTNAAPSPLRNVTRIRHDQTRHWGCIQILWDAGLYEDEHPMSAASDENACERLLRYEHMMPTGAPRDESGASYFTFKSVGRTHQSGRATAHLLDLGALSVDEWCAESSQPFWQVVAQRVLVVARQQAK
jgi:hypothetical protein